MSTVTIPRSEILDLINCAEDYGFQRDVLLDAFAGWLGRSVSDEDITAYIAEYIPPEKGYGEEDAAATRERLEEFRKRYCDGAKVPQ